MSTMRFKDVGAALLCGVALAGVLLAGGAGAAPPKEFGISGFIVINPPRAADRLSIHVPGVRIALQKVSANQVVEKVVTDLSGRFRFSPQPPGRYQVCWKARGIQPGCGKPFAVRKSHIYLQQLRVPPVIEGAKTLYGTVKLGDGSRPRRLEPMLGINAFATVTAVDAGGTRRASGYANNFGQYVLPGVKNTANGRVAGKIEAAGVDKPIGAVGTLSKRIDLTFSKQAPPKVKGLIGEAPAGTHWTALPGDTVKVKAVATDPDGDPLTYHWFLPDGSATPNAPFGDTASVQLPNRPGNYEFTVLVGDGRGGYAKDSIVIATAGVRFGGTVLATDAPVIAGAVVEVNGKTATSDARGHFALFVPEAPRYVLNIRKAGYGLISQIYDNSIDGGRWMLTRASVESVDPKQPIDVTNRRKRGDCPGALGDRKPNTPRDRDPRECGPGIRVRIPANALVDGSGNPPPGNVNIELTTVDLRAPEGMPGDYTARNTAGDVRVMRSYGAGTIEISAGGVEYNLKPGQQGEITIPIDPAQLAFPATIPAMIPSLSYDEKRGIWVEEEALQRVGNAYVGKVKHFSAENADILKTDQACIRLETVLLPAQFKLQATIPPPGGGADIVKTPTITNTAQRFHALYNLPTNVNVKFRVFNLPGNAPIELIDPASPGTATFEVVVSSGATQNPVDPNKPEFPYAACQTSVELTPFKPVGAAIDEFLAGFTLGSVNLTDLETTDPGIATAFKNAGEDYYDAIDPLDLRANLDEFKARNVFPTAETNLKYANSGDLGFGRDMHCRKVIEFGEDEYACYVTNYGSRFTNDEQDYLDALNNTVPIATVGMEYSRVEDATDPSGNTFVGAPIVKFYVFKEALGNAHAVSADLDGTGERPVPQLCTVCHGGRTPDPLGPESEPVWTDAASVDLGSKFIPFDQASLFMLNANGAANQAALRKLNCDIVKQTAVGDGVTELLEVIESMYGAACSGNQQLGNPVPGWVAAQPPGAPNQQQAYAKVVTPSCRTCHVSQGPATVTWASANEFHQFGGFIASLVCDSHVMPHALVTHNRFWLSTNPHQPLLMHDFLNFNVPPAQEVAGTCISP